MVVNAAQTEDVLFGSGGVAAAMRAGSVFVMCSTVDPNWSIALEARLAERGLLYLDAPISGGAAKAASGADDDDDRRAAPRPMPSAGAVLDAMAAKVYRLGDRAGAGSKVKIINQLLAGVHIAAAAEAMALGLREGVDAAALYEVITHSAGNSWMFENRMAHVLAGRLHAAVGGGHLRQGPGPGARHWRAPASFRCRCRAPRTRCSCRPRRAGFAKEDDSAVIKIFPGIELPEPKP